MSLHDNVAGGASAAPGGPDLTALVTPGGSAQPAQSVDDLVTPPGAPAQTAQPEAQQAAPEPEDGFKQFTAQFEKYTGTKFDDFISSFSMVQQDYYQRTEERYKQSLRSKLGEDNFDARYDAINERFNQLSPEQQQGLLALGNEEAALLIDQALQREAAAKAQAANPDVPGLDRNSASGTGGKRTWKRSEIRSLSRQEYAKLEQDITLAYQEGRVVNDV